MDTTAIDSLVLSFKGHPINLHYKPWESGILKKKVVGIEFEKEIGNNYGKMHSLLSELTAAAKTIDDLIFVIRIATDSLPAVRAVESARFNLMECFLVLKHSLAGINEPNGPGENPAADVRFYKENDLAVLKKIAYTSFTRSRFHMDENIDNNLASKTRESWLENSCNGRASFVLVSTDGKEPGGFLICKEKKDELGNRYANLDLMAVNPARRKQGQGRKLVSFFLTECRNRSYDYALVGTQAHNTLSVGLYEKSGFRIHNTFYTYHLHSKDIK